MKSCLSHARIALAEPDAVIGRLCSHMAEHGGRDEERDGVRILYFAGSQARFIPDGEATLIEATAGDLEELYQIRSIVAGHLMEFTGGQGLQIEWTGDGSDLMRPPNFQILQVVGRRDITPHMRRLTFIGEDVARFAPMSALHVNLLLQHPAAADPQWPMVGRNGLIHWADPDRRPTLRKYTVRSLDVAAGTLDIDFVRHADAGPGAAFAETAGPGDRIGVIGPGGGGFVEADWYLFAGDETALPAIARMLEQLPEQARGKALIEVADAAEIQALVVKAGIAVDWLLRDGAPAGSTTLLADAVRAVAFPSDGSRVYAWAGCEYQAFRAIRRYLREDRGLAACDHLAVSYWRTQGHDDVAAAR